MTNEDHRSADARRGLPRWLARAAVLSLPVVALSAITVGSASAHEDDHGSDSNSGGDSSGFTPTTPVDAFADHWEQYHKGKDITSEPETIMKDPNNYVKIHEDMVQHMLGH